MQVLPDIYEINGSEFGRWQNTFLVAHAGATVMVDCGEMANRPTVAKGAPAVNGLREVEENASIWSFALSDVSHLLVTHEHFDHASHAAELQRRGIEIVASEKAAEPLAVADRRVIGWAHGRDVEPYDVDVVVGDGEVFTVGELAVRGIAVPGHSAGSMVLEVIVDQKRHWFTGDLYLTVGPHIGVQLPWMGDINSDEALYTESLEKLLAEPRPHSVFPDHGPTAIGCGYAALEMAYHQALTTRHKGRHQR